MSGGAASQLRRLWSAEGLSLAVGLVQGLVIARQLGPHRYGTYALAVTAVAFIFLVLDPRAADAVIRYLSEHRTRGDVPGARAVLRAGYLLDASWAAAGLLVALLTAGAGARLLNIDGYAGLIAVVALGACLSAPTATSKAVLSVFGRFSGIARLQVAVAVLRAGVVVVILLTDAGLWGVVWALTLVSVAEAVIFVVTALRSARGELGSRLLRSSLAPLRPRAREMARFVVLADLSTLASTAIKQVDTLVLGILTGPREAGYYRLAKSLTAPAANVGLPVQTLLYPRLAAAESAGDFARADALIRRTTSRVCLPLAVAALVALSLVEPAITLVAGDQFRDATPATIALVVGVAVSFATLQLKPMFLVRDQLRSMLAFTVATAVVSVLAFFPSADRFGAEGVAWVRTAAIAIGAFCMTSYLHRTAWRRRRHPVEVQQPSTFDVPL